LLKAKIALISIFALLVLISGCARQAPASGWSGPIVSGDTLYVGSPGGRVYALDRERRKEIWRFPQEERLAAIYSTPSVVQETLYFSSYGGKVYALQVEDGSKLWEFETGGPVVATPLLMPSVLRMVARSGSSRRGHGSGVERP